PMSLPSSTTGTRRMRRFSMKASAADAVTWGPSTIAGADIQFRTNMRASLFSADLQGLPRGRLVGRRRRHAPTEEHRAGRLADDFLGDAAEQDARQAAPAVRRHAEQRRSGSFEMREDFMG